MHLLEIQGLLSVVLHNLRQGCIIPISLVDIGDYRIRLSLINMGQYMFFLLGNVVWNSKK